MWRKTLTGFSIFHHPLSLACPSQIIEETATQFGMSALMQEKPFSVSKSCYVMSCHDLRPRQISGVTCCHFFRIDITDITLSYSLIILPLVIGEYSKHCSANKILISIQSPPTPNIPILRAPTALASTTTGPCSRTRV